MKKISKFLPIFGFGDGYYHNFWLVKDKLEGMWYEKQ